MADDILSQFFAGRRGGSNVFGGPRLPQRQPQPAAPPRPSVRRGGGDFEKMVESLAAEKKKTEGVQAAQNAIAQLNEGGGGLGGVIESGLGTVLGGAATAFGFMGRSVVAGLDNLAGTGFGQAAVGSGNVAGQVLSGFDTTDNDTQASFGERVMDPSFGYGTAMKSTGNRAADIAFGFTGDVMFDPLTYVGGSAAKAAIGTDRASREAMAQMLMAADRSNEVVGSASKYGAAFLNEADRALVGARAPGLYFGIGETSARIPGTQTLGRALERGGARLRTNTISRVTNRANLAMRTNDELRVSRRVMNSGRAIGDVTPRIAAARMRFAGTADRVMRDLADTEARQIDSLLLQLDDDTARMMTHALAKGDDIAGEYRAFFDRLRTFMDEAGIDVGEITLERQGVGYVPQRFRREGYEWLKETPEGQALAREIHWDPTSDVSALRTRMIKGGSTLELPGNVKVVIPEGASPVDINDAIQKAIPNAPRVFEEDIRVLAKGYIGEYAKAMGLRDAWKQLRATAGDDIAVNLQDVGVRELDELASITANKKLAKVLKTASKRRVKQLEKRRKQAEDAVEAARKGVLKQMDDHTKKLASEHKVLSGELKTVSDELKKVAPDAAKIEQSFNKMRRQVEQERERIIAELYQLDDELAALNADAGIDAIPMGRPEGTAPSAYVTARERQQQALDVARARLRDELEGAVDAEDRLNALYADLYEVGAYIRSWDEALDSPHVVRDEAEAASERLGTVYEDWLVDTMEERSTVWSDSIKAKLDAAPTREEEAEILEALRQARRYDLLAEGFDAKADRLRRELDANLEAQRAARDAWEAPVAVEDEVPASGRLMDPRVEAERLQEMNTAARQRLAGERDAAEAATVELRAAQAEEGAALERLRGAEAAAHGRGAQGGGPQPRLVVDADVEAKPRTRYEPGGNVEDELRAARRQVVEDTPEGEALGPRMAADAPRTAEQLSYEKEMEKRWRDALGAAAQARDKTHAAAVRAGMSSAKAGSIADEISSLADDWFARRAELARIEREMGLEALTPAEAAGMAWRTTEDDTALVNFGISAILSDPNAAEKLRPETLNVFKLKAREQAIRSEIGNAREAATRYRGLHKRPALEGNSKAALADQWELAKRIERAEQSARYILWRVERSAVVRDTLQTETQYREYADWLRAEIDQLTQETAELTADSRVASGLPIKGSPWNLSGEGREVTDYEASVVAEHLSELDDAVRRAQQEVDKVRNDRAKLFPQGREKRELQQVRIDKREEEIVEDLKSRLADPDGITPDQDVALHAAARQQAEMEMGLYSPPRMSARDTSYSGVQVGDKAMTREQYLKATESAKPGVRPMRARELETGWIDEGVNVDVGELDPDNIPLRGDGLADETLDAADDIVASVDESTAFDFEQLADMYLTQNPNDRVLWDMNDQLGAAQEVLRAAKQARSEALRSYGLSGDASEGWAYGRWGNIMLVDTSPSPPKKNPKGTPRFSRERAISITEKDLEAELRRRGLYPNTGRKLGHHEMAELLGWKVKYYPYNKSAWKSLPQDIKDSAAAFAAKERIRQMSPDARRVVMAKARSRASETANTNKVIVRELQKELRDAEAGLAQLAETKARMVAERAKTQEQFDNIVGKIESVEAAQKRVDVAEAGVRRYDDEQAAMVAKQEAQLADAAVREGRATDRQQVLYRQSEALDAVEQQVGRQEAKAITDLQVETVIKREQRDLAQRQVWQNEGRQKAVAKLKSDVPKPLRTGATGKQIRTRFEALKELSDAARRDGGVELGLAADLMLQAERKLVALEREESFIKGLQRMQRLAAKGSKEGAKERLETVERLMVDGFTSIKSQVFPEDDIAFNETLVRMIQNTSAALKDEPGWLKLYDDATQFFKTYATATPGFHLRNFMSAVFMNMTEGVGAATHLEAFSEWQKYVRAATDNKVDEWWAGLSPEMQMGFQTVFGSGTGGMFSEAELGAKLGASRLTNNALTRFSKRVGEDYVEGPVRLALGLQYARRGASMESALAQVNRIHFNYSDVSNFDRTMKRLIPFWTFMSRNMPMQIEQMWKKPKAYAIFNHAMNNLDQGEDGDIMPQWMKRAGGIFVGRDIPFLGGADMVITPDMPHLNMQADVADIVEDPKSLMSSLNPLIKIPYEQVSGESTFTGAPLFEGEDNTLSNRVGHVVKNMVPFVGQAERLSGRGRYEGKELEKLLNYLGLPIRSVGDREVASEVRRRALSG